MSDIFPPERSEKIPRRAPSSRYADAIPTGVNVLVVDANDVSLVITKAKLCHFGYTVFTAGGVAEAASMVEDRSTDIHLVLSEACLPGAERFEILDKLRRRSDVAVVILTDDEDKDAMMEALKRGAFFYLVKPISPFILTKLWQFALVKKREGYAARLSENRGADLAAALTEEKPEKDKKTLKGSNAEKMDGKKRRVGKKEKDKEGDGDDPAARERRPKLAWTLELHKRFLQAMEVLGPDRAHPKGILQQMNIPGLRKEHISSHLQKYRIYLKNMEKLAAEKGIPLAAPGIVPAYHLSQSSAAAGEHAEVMAPSLGASSSWAVVPIIGGVDPLLVQSSSSSAGVTQLRAIGTRSMLHEPNSNNQSVPTYIPGLNAPPPGYKLPETFSRGSWMKHDGMIGLPGSFNSDRHVCGTQDEGHATVTQSTLEVKDKQQQQPLLPRSPDNPSFN